MEEYYPQSPQAQPSQPVVDFNAPSGLWLTVGGAEKLKTIASWSKFFSVVMLIYLILMLLGGILVGGAAFRMPAHLTKPMLVSSIIYIVLFVVMIFPTIAYLKFANKAKRAYKFRDNVALQESLGSMAFALQYWGVLAIISIVFLVVSVVITVRSAILPT